VAILLAILLAVFVLPHPWGIVVVAAAAVVDVGESVLLLRWSQRRRATVGAGTLVGKQAVALTALSPEGQVKIDGEIWNARSAGRVDAGTELRVVAVDGLTLEVEPA
jgi:membrane-bound serine protease (ClpP class)